MAEKATDQDATDQDARRELAQRTTCGMDVKLFWSKAANRLAVQVSDAKSGEFFELDAAGDCALDVFYHPYAYAARQGVGSSEDRTQEVATPEFGSIALKDF